jgi:hypothetical protein
MKKVIVVGLTVAAVTVLVMLGVVLRHRFAPHASEVSAREEGNQEFFDTDARPTRRPAPAPLQR